MIIALHNYKKDLQCLYSIKSIKHFFPEQKIYLFNFSRLNEDLIDEFAELDCELFYCKTKYEGSGQGFCSKKNGLYFGESINTIWNYFKDIDDKVLILDECCYILNPDFINECLNNDFILGWYRWEIAGDKKGVAGDRLCINPVKLKHLFPLPEQAVFIEKLLKYCLINKLNEGVYQFKTIDYKYRSDGSEFINDAKQDSAVFIKEQLINKGIL